MIDSDILELLAALMSAPSATHLHAEERVENDVARWLVEHESSLCAVLRDQPKLLEQLGSAADRHQSQDARFRLNTRSADGRRGALVVIEGIDGSGKGTQAELLHASAKREGVQLDRLSFPRYGQTVFSLLIAQYLNGKFGTIDTVPARCSALLFAGDRFESRALLEAMIGDTDLVVLDRYVASNVAYHAARVARHQQASFRDWLYGLEYGAFGMPLPDQHIFLDVPADLATRWVLLKAPRSYTDAAADIHERRADYMQRCREMFLELSVDATFGPWQRIDCLDSATGKPLPVSVVAEMAWSIARSARSFPPLLSRVEPLVRSH